ncbi:phospholipase D-like domain-containing protein [Haloarchaeobius baliensis]|uniref:phospholipase D-like domain-containing protein n=1 Tax=Haloarchaeobius baliensis TaxID=1670458 RepID=UPI003F882B70
MSRTARPVLATLVVLSLVATAGASAPATDPSEAPGPQNQSPTDAAALVAVLPNPVAEGDAGEYVVARFSEPTALDGWTVGDDDGAAPLPNVTVAGRVAFTADPAALPADANGTVDRVVRVADFPRLANGGEQVVLARNGSRVDVLGYTDAPEAERWTGERWVPRGATDLEPARGGPGEVRAFVTPDTAVPLDAIVGADDRVLLAGYTFTSDRVTDALLAAADRGVAVRVLVDDAPVGGLSAREVAALDRLEAGGVAVRLLGGDAARYDFHHAKYLVADDRALVLTENWKPSGTGGHANRGWGVALNGSEPVAALNRTFHADWTAHDAAPWLDQREAVDPVLRESASGSYPTRIEPTTVPVDSTTVLVAPDNAEASLVSLVAGAESSVRVEQMSVGGVETPLVQAALAAARNGSRVRFLLSSAWYAEDENGRVVERLNAIAEREGLDLAARLVDPGGRFEKLHAKGVVVDERHVVVGSVNWNRNSLRDNREVAVVLTGDEVGRYYAEAFDTDWRGGGGGGDGRQPRLLWVAAIAAAALAVLVCWRRVQFEYEGELQG